MTKKRRSSKQEKKEHSKAKSENAVKSSSSKLKDYIKSFLSFLTIIIAILSLYYTYIEPDIKYSSFDVKEKLIDRKIDKNNNFVYYYSISPRFKNLSFKRGYIDKVEFSPLSSIDAIPDTTVTNIRKVPIGWNNEEEVEIKFIVTVPTEFDTMMKEKKVSAELIMNVFDNTGKIIEKATDGQFARIKLDLWGTIGANKNITK